MLRGIIFLMVHTKDDRDVLILGGGGDDHLPDRTAQVLLGVVGVSKAAGRLDHDLRAHRFPGQGSGILFLENFYDLSIHRNAVRAGADRIRQIAENGIVLQQVRQRLRIGEVVDRHKFQVWIVERGA
jgi:hypothetical protein